MHTKQRILLKLTGEIFLSSDKKSLDAANINALIEQIKTLRATHQFGIVVGGGNFFRGNIQGTALGMTAPVGHQVGMLATMMNGLILKDLLEQQDMPTSLLCAISCPEVGTPISQQTIENALHKDHTLVFTGGTGNPFFTTDTNAVLRSLQINAAAIWKGTNIDGVYDANPRTVAHAQLLKKVSYADALQKRLGIMDATAFALAQQHNQTIRVFNIFTPDALLQATNNQDFGSVIY
ncbi:MAG: UMP kinase [Candidatus Dependentiae bacterium]|nr:UMP kinase [Candidatus Dependentiae bacterium]